MLFLGQEFCALWLQLKVIPEKENDTQDLMSGRVRAITPSCSLPKAQHFQ